MRRLVWGVLVAGAFALPAHGQEERESFSCERDSVVRNVSVVATPDGANACEVHYERASEGAPPQLLWHAQSDPGYCSAQASALVGRLQQAGWSCGPGTQSAALMPAEPKSVPVAVQGSGLTAAIAPAKPAATVPSELLKLRPTIR